MPGEKSKSPFECLNDVSTEKDILGFKPYVEAIAEFLTAEGTRPPITLSIEGDWGCGKSSFMKQLQKEIEKINKSEKKENGFLESLFPKRKEYFTIWFNCWRYEKEDELWAAFALSLMEQLSEQLSWGWRQLAKMKLLWLRVKFRWKSDISIFSHVIGQLSYVGAIFAFWIGIIYFGPKLMRFLFEFSTGGSNFNNSFSDFVNIFLNMENSAYSAGSGKENSNPLTILSSSMLVLTGVVKLFNHTFSFLKEIKNLAGNPFDFGKFVSNSNYKDHISFIEYFHSDFNKIIASYAGNSKVYVFVDDLDRCEVPKSAELMQAINLMISDDSKIYFSLGIDRKVISAGLAAKNEKVLEYLDVEGLEYGYDFIEKFIQLPFKVPRPKSAEFLKFLTSLDENESSSEPSEPMDISNRPEGNIKSSQNANSGQETGTNDLSNVVTELSQQEIQSDEDCLEDSETSKLILEMVAPALDNNPRRIKQFINQFRFHKSIGKRTGLFSYHRGTKPENMWNCKKLAKFVAINLKWHDLVSDLKVNRRILYILQECALGKEIEYESLGEWTKDEILMELLRYGCVDENNVSKNEAEYSLSGLDFTKLLQISPVVESDPSMKMEFVSIPAGEFMMGSVEHSSEQPVHKVEIGRPFKLGKYPVTQKQWKYVMGRNPSHFKGDDRPVENVSWNDIKKFIKQLNEMEDAAKYRLPSEAEWEYACRAGTTTRYSFGDDGSKLGEYAWYGANSGGETHPVGMKKPNLWGLHDMHGNVWELVQDKWHDTYNAAPSDGSAWENGDGFLYVSRGGSWTDFVDACSSVERDGYGGDNRVDFLGFRLLKEI